MTRCIPAPGLAALLLCAIVPFAAPPPSVAAEQRCQIGKLLDLPITMQSLRPLVPVKVNGAEGRFLLDSGAFYSMISTASAAEYQLRTRAAPFGLTVKGIGGAASVSMTSVKEFSLAGAALKNVEFLVGGSEVGADGILGQNFLELLDVEYDLANGMIRLFKSDHCEHVGLAYWVKPDQTFSTMDIERISPYDPHTIGVAYINGQKIRVTFDTGAFTSVLSLKAAARAGIKPDSPGVVDAGYVSGIGKATVRQYIGPFASFKIGDQEEIKNTRLRFADLGLNNSDMLLGADFFVSHRILVANKEHKLFLTYNGGPVFNLKASSVASTTVAPKDGADNPTATQTPDAADSARRGAALAARRDFIGAITELTQAILLRPDEPEYRYQRAAAYRANGQRDLALADYDQTIVLKRDFLQAYIPRAEIKLELNDAPGAIEDLQSVAAQASPQADLRYTLAELYLRLERFPDAVTQYDEWIQNHPDDSRLVWAQSGRCYASALLDRDLENAMSDCNAAVRHVDKNNANATYVYVSRGLLRLRQGYYDKAVADFTDALARMPTNALATYARGVAESYAKDTRQSAADLRAADDMDPTLAKHFARFGIAPK